MLNLMRIVLGAAVLAFFSSAAMAQPAGATNSARNASHRAQAPRAARNAVAPSNPSAFVDDCSNHPFSRGCDKRGQW